MFFRPRLPHFLGELSFAASLSGSPQLVIETTKMPTSGVLLWMEFLCPRHQFMQPSVLQEFYVDFAHVAEDESRHFGWCMQRLKELGYSYGDMVAHGMLWDGAIASSGQFVHLTNFVTSIFLKPQLDIKSEGTHSFLAELLDFVNEHNSMRLSEHSGTDKW